MSVYTANVPLTSQSLNETQPLINDNFTLINTYIGQDHVAFTAGSDQGLHNTVTTPDQGSPPTTTTNPKIFAYEVESATGLLQFSRGPNDAQPTPLTNFYIEFLTVDATPKTIIDLTNVTNCVAIVTAVGTGPNPPATYSSSSLITKTNNVVDTNVIVNSGTMQISDSGQLITIVNPTATASNVKVSVNFQWLD